MRGNARGRAPAGVGRRAAGARGRPNRAGAPVPLRRRRFVWELPAGRRDPDETPESGALRELEEEVGLKAGDLERISTFWTTPGFCDEVMHLFRATAPRDGAGAPGGRRAHRAGHVHARRGARDDPRGEIREGKTLVALLLERAREPQRSEETCPEGGLGDEVPPAQWQTDRGIMAHVGLGGRRPPAQEGGSSLVAIRTPPMIALPPAQRRRQQPRCDSYSYEIALEESRARTLVRVSSASRRWTCFATCDRTPCT